MPHAEFCFDCNCSSLCPRTACQTQTNMSFVANSLAEICFDCSSTEFPDGLLPLHEPLQRLGGLRKVSFRVSSMYGDSLLPGLFTDLLGLGVIAITCSESVCPLQIDICDEGCYEPVPYKPYGFYRVPDEYLYQEASAFVSMWQFTKRTLMSGGGRRDVTIKYSRGGLLLTE